MVGLDAGRAVKAALAVVAPGMALSAGPALSPCPALSLAASFILTTARFTGERTKATLVLLEVRDGSPGQGRTLGPTGAHRFASRRRRQRRPSQPASALPDSAWEPDGHPESHIKGPDMVETQPKFLTAPVSPWSCGQQCRY